jgi:hypothetical protein
MEAPHNLRAMGIECGAMTLKGDVALDTAAGRVSRMTIETNLEYTIPDGQMGIRSRYVIVLLP